MGRGIHHDEGAKPLIPHGRPYTNSHSSVRSKGLVPVHISNRPQGAMLLGIQFLDAILNAMGMNPLSGSAVSSQAHALYLFLSFSCRRVLEAHAHSRHAPPLYLVLFFEVSVVYVRKR